MPTALKEATTTEPGVKDIGNMRHFPNGDIGIRDPQSGIYKLWKKTPEGETDPCKVAYVPCYCIVSDDDAVSGGTNGSGSGDGSNTNSTSGDVGSGGEITQIAQLIETLNQFMEQQAPIIFAGNYCYRSTNDN